METNPKINPMISIDELKQIVYRESGYKMRISDNDPILATVYINSAVLGVALDKLNAGLSSLQKLPALAEREMNRASVLALERLSEKVSDIAQEIAVDAANAEKVKGYKTAIIVATVSATILIGVGFIAGIGWNKLQIASIESKAKLRIEQAEKDTRWMNSEEGLAAKKLAEVGAARNLYECNQPAKPIVRQDKTYCIYYPENNKAYGWRIK